MAVDVQGFLKDKKVWAFGGVGAGLGLLVYLRRKKQPAGGASGTDASGQPYQVIQPAAADSSSIDAYNNLQNEIENLAGQVTGLYGGTLPTAQQAVAPTNTAKAYSYSGAYANVLSQIRATYKSPGVEALKAPAGYVFRTNAKGQTYLVYTGK